MDIPKKFIAGVLKERGKPGQDWLDALPSVIRKFSDLWQLHIDGAPMHGYIGLVLPVRRNTEACVLKVYWVDEETRHEAIALSAWRGVGAVLVLESAPEAGVMLLERLDSRTDLTSIEINEATAIATRLLKRLAISAPAELGHTRTFAHRQTAAFQERWERVGKPFSESLLEHSIALAGKMASGGNDFLVNQDLHFENVLRGRREEWLVIDPKPIAGDIEFGAAPLLWNRAEEGNIHKRLSVMLESADLDKHKLKAWTHLRLIDYWLWALAQGFTEDPERCRMLVEQLQSF